MSNSVTQIIKVNKIVALATYLICDHGGLAADARDHQLELALEDLLVAVAEEDEAPIDEGQDEPATEEPSAPVLRRRPRVTDATPRERRELDPGTCCPDCGGDLRVVGEDVSELLDMIAAQMKVVQIAWIKKSCRRCERMVQEPAPSRPIPGSMAGPNLLAHVRIRPV